MILVPGPLWSLWASRVLQPRRRGLCGGAAAAAACGCCRVGRLVAITRRGTQCLPNRQGTAGPRFTSLTKPITAGRGRFYCRVQHVRWAAQGRGRVLRAPLVCLSLSICLVGSLSISVCLFDSLCVCQRWPGGLWWFVPLPAHLQQVKRVCQEPVPASVSLSGVLFFCLRVHFNVCSFQSKCTCSCSCVSVNLSTYAPVYLCTCQLLHLSIYAPVCLCCL